MTDPATPALVDLLVERLGPIVRAAVEEATRAALEAQAPPPAARLLTVAEVAERLSCCPESVRRRVKSGDLPAVRSLGHLRFRAEDVDRLAGAVS